jgi:hypothetical protein
MLRPGAPVRADNGPHDLRHTGNYLTSQGASLRDVMARMGHASTRAAVIYQQPTATVSGRSLPGFRRRSPTPWPTRTGTEADHGGVRRPPGRDERRTH